MAARSPRSTAAAVEVRLYQVRELVAGRQAEFGVQHRPEPLVVLDRFDDVTVVEMRQGDGAMCALMEGLDACRREGGLQSLMAALLGASDACEGVECTESQLL